MKWLMLFLSVALIIFLTGCDLFGNGGGSGKITVSIFMKISSVPEDLYRADGKWVKIELHLLSLKIFGVERDPDKNIDSSSSYDESFDSFDLSKGSKDTEVELTFSPKATVSIYSGMLFIESKELALESTKLTVNLVRFSGDSMVNYNDLYISTNENIWILLELDGIEDLYSSPTGNLNVMVLRESDLVNITGHVDGWEEHLIKFESGYYRTLSTFTKDGDFSMKLPKGDYGVTVEVYGIEEAEPSTSIEIHPTEDKELNL